MKEIMTVGLDLAKNVIHVIGCDRHGKEIGKKTLGRGQVLNYFANLPACLIGMEACTSAHDWARRLRELGHEVRLIPAQYVKAYGRGNKTDYNDARAIAEAVRRPDMRFVTVKTVEQQDVQARHRLRQARVAERTAARDEPIKALELKAQGWAGRLDRQDAGARYRGRKLSDGGVTARFHQAVSDAKLSRIIKLDLRSALFTYDIDEKALALARLMDGKLLLVTHVTDLSSTEIVSRYKALADIERGFRVLKSEIEIAPVFHRLPDRIRAHALICFLALVLYRVLRMRLKAKDSPYSPERALEIT